MRTRTFSYAHANLAKLWDEIEDSQARPYESSVGDIRTCCSFQPTSWRVSRGRHTCFVL